MDGIEASIGGRCMNWDGADDARDAEGAPADAELKAPRRRNALSAETIESAAQRAPRRAAPAHRVEGPTAHAQCKVRTLRANRAQLNRNEFCSPNRGQNADISDRM
jgi:hypothetical protein